MLFCLLILKKQFLLVQKGQTTFCVVFTFLKQIRRGGEVPAWQAAGGRDLLTRVLNFFRGGRMEEAFVECAGQDACSGDFP